MKTELRLPDNDNKKLANLCGVLDENISQISAGLDIEINRRGTFFTFLGKKRILNLDHSLLKVFMQELVEQ